MMDFLDRFDKAVTFKGLLSFLLVLLLFFSFTVIPADAQADYAATQTKETRKGTNPNVNYSLPIIVSLGDSYSSGEGIEPFYDQELPNETKVRSVDWLAHRSKGSWPGRLKFSELYSETKNYKDENWFFVASSGAKTKHLKGKQNKDYDRNDLFAKYADTVQLDPQLDVFNQMDANTVDYVTITIGGNDVKFSKIIQKAYTSSPALDPNGLSNMINDIWTQFYAEDGIKEDIYKAYQDIEAAAGKQAQIIVAGYPLLISPQGGGIGLGFTASEAFTINEATSKFNAEISSIVNFSKLNGMKISFVPVEDAFNGHAAYDSSAYINPVYLGTKAEDLKNIDVASAYSVHPNSSGAQAYADCVNAKIQQLEEEAKAQLEFEAMHPEKNDREVVLVLDRSGSMDGTPMRETLTAAKEFVKTTLETKSANIGVVSYADDAKLVSPITDSDEWIYNSLNTISAFGSTNIEAGLKTADEMLQNSEAKKKIIVLMSDGMPNEGRVGDDLITYANELKDKGYYIYALGFFSAVNNLSTVQGLMNGIASENCYFNIDNAESLGFFFGDIADQIQGTKFYYIRIACPVDVEVVYNGEKLSSKNTETSVRTSFGSLTFEENSAEEDEEAETNHSPLFGGSSLDQEDTTVDNRIKILRLKEGVDYDIRILGNGKGEMNYSISFMNDDGEYTDTREFKRVKITKRTEINTVAALDDETYMYVDQDGDGKHDITYKAEFDSRAQVVDNSGIITAVIILAVILLLLIGGLIALRRYKISKYL